MAKKEANLETIIQKLRKQNAVYQDFQKSIEPLMLTSDELDCLVKLSKLDIEAMQASTDKLKKIEKLIDGVKIQEESPKEKDQSDIQKSMEDDSEEMSQARPLTSGNIGGPINLELPSSDMSKKTIDIVGPTEKVITSIPESKPIEKKEITETEEKPIDIVNPVEEKPIIIDKIIKEKDNVEPERKSIEENSIDLNAIPEISWDSFNTTPEEISPTARHAYGTHEEEMSTDTVLHM